MASKNFDTKLYASLSSLSLTNANSTNILNLIDTETQKNVDSLIERRDDLEQRITWLNEISKNIEEVSSHPRVASRAKMSKFVEVDCLLNTSEYCLKYAEFSVISSLKMTLSYCQKSIEDMEAQIVTYNEQIERVTDQHLLAKEVSGGHPIEVHRSENSIVTVYENGLVDIVETEEEPYVRVVRSPRFKTCAERDKYVQEAKTQQTESVKAMNCACDVLMGRSSGFSGGEVYPSQLDKTCSSPESQEFIMRTSLYQKTVQCEKELQLQLDVLREILPLMNNDAIAFGVALDNYHVDECSNEYNGIPFFQFIDTPGGCEDFINKKEEFSKSFNDTQKAIYFLIQEAEGLLEKIALLCYEIDNFSQARDDLHLVRQYHFNRFLELHQNDSNPEVNEERNAYMQTVPCRTESSVSEIVVYSRTPTTEMKPVTKCVLTMKSEPSSVQEATRKKQIQSMKNKLTDMINTL